MEKSEHYILAAALGCSMEFFSVGDKVSNGKQIQGLLSEALKYNPKDGSAHYILGRYHYEASNLPWAVSSKYKKKIDQGLSLHKIFKSQGRFFFR